MIGLAAALLSAWPAAFAFAGRVSAPVPIVGPAPAVRLAPSVLPAPLASAIVAPISSPSTLRPLAAVAAALPVKRSIREALIHGAKPFSKAAQLPLAGLDADLRAFWEAGRGGASEPEPRPDLGRPTARRAPEFGLVKPGDPGAARPEAPKPEPPAPGPEGPESPSSGAPAPPASDWKHKARVAFSVTVGTLLIIVGIIMIPLPGPGAVLALIGLAMLAKHFAWAKRLLGAVRRRLAVWTRPLRRRLRARRLARIRARREEAAPRASD
ncbi:MAG: hypothetical protein HY553_04775 [Elusimicrobia bacterium]|nr:hypothetical protein [Elusimicrobiota bacterium]